MKDIKEVLDELKGIYLSNPEISVSEAEGHIVVKHFHSPSQSIITQIVPERLGYVLIMIFPVGAEAGKAAFATGINTINKKIVSGCFVVDDDGQLLYKNFIPFHADVSGKDIASAITIGFGTFMESLYEIGQILRPLSGIKDSEFIITDVEEGEAR